MGVKLGNILLGQRDRTTLKNVKRGRPYTVRAHNSSDVFSKLFFRMGFENSKFFAVISKYVFRNKPLSAMITVYR